MAKKVGTLEVEVKYVDNGKDIFDRIENLEKFRENLGDEVLEINGILALADRLAALEAQVKPFGDDPLGESLAAHVLHAFDRIMKLEQDYKAFKESPWWDGVNDRLVKLEAGALFDVPVPRPLYNKYTDPNSPDYDGLFRKVQRITAEEVNQLLESILDDKDLQVAADALNKRFGVKS